MLPTFVIGLREGIEAALIVGILAAYLKQRGRADALRWVWIGIGIAASVCLGIGIFLHFLEKSLPQREQEGLETVIALVAIAFITYMIIWMRRNSRGIKRSLEDDASSALARNTVSAFVLMAFLAVLREGFETSVFVLAVFQNAADPVAAGAGAVLGLLIAAVFGYLLYRGGVRINLNRFFRLTGVVLGLVVAGLAASALHTAHEAGWFDYLQTPALDLSWLVVPGSVRAALLTGMLGLQPKPNVGEVLIWLLVAIPLTLYVIWPAKSQRSGSGGSGNGHRLFRRVAGTVSSSLLLLLLIACGSSSPNNDQGAVDASKTQVVNVSLTEAGCDPAQLKINTGPTTFNVTNKDAAAVTEMEVMDGSRILGEVENLTPGLNGSFSLNLNPGSYTLYCPHGKSAEKGTLTVSGEQSAVPSTHPAAQAAVDQYRAFLEEQTTVLVDRTSQFVTAIRAGDIEQAKSQYARARSPYEQIEPVAESFGDLDPAIDAREGDVPADQWTGFHRLEKALWVDGSLDRMTPVAEKLLADVRQLQDQVRQCSLDVGQIANGSVELLNEVSKSKITGEEERYSHTDLVDFQANVDGAQAAFAAVKPILAGQDAELTSQIMTQFDAVHQALARYKSGDGYVLYTELTTEDTRQLSQAIDALAEPLSHVAEQVILVGK